MRVRAFLAIFLAPLPQKHGVAADFYHAGRTDREDVQYRWTKDELQVICATIAFGMGVPPNLSLLSPLPPPNSPDDAAETHCPADGNDLPEVFTTFAPNPPSGATSIIRHQRDCLLCFRGSLQ